MFSNNSRESTSSVLQSQDISKCKNSTRQGKRKKKKRGLKKGFRKGRKKKKTMQ
jgi:hypothetical protein